MLNVAAISQALGAAPLLAQPPGTTAATGWSPSQLIPGWVSDGTYVTFPIASIDGLTTAVADGTTGDAREVVWRMASHFFEWYNETVVDENSPTAVTAKLAAGSFKTVAPFLGRQKMDLTFTAFVEFPSLVVASELEGVS